MTFFTNTASLLVYIVTTVYLTLLGVFMLTRKDGSAATHGEQMGKLRIMRTVGVFMLLWAFDWIIYLLPMLRGNDVTGWGFDVCFLLTMMLETPALYVVMHAIVQKRVNTQRWICSIALPFGLLLLWFVCLPADCGNRLPVHLASALNLLFIACLLVKYAKEYRIYVRRIKGEYSDMTGREILWVWSCFAGFAMQAVVFLLYEYTWMPWMMYYYWGLSSANSAYLCYCTCRQKALDRDVVERLEDETTDAGNVDVEGQSGEKAFYTVIERRLKSLCEDRLLFLEPDLTRQMLCQHLSVSSTYLKLYFHSRGLTFYQYVNTLRVEYAVRLMQENPEMPIREVSELSGFNSQTTFRKMFREVMGCLPSDMRKGATAMSDAVEITTTDCRP